MKKLSKVEMKKLLGGDGPSLCPTQQECSYYDWQTDTVIISACNHRARVITPLLGGGVIMSPGGCYCGNSLVNCLQ